MTKPLFIQSIKNQVIKVRCIEYFDIVQSTDGSWYIACETANNRFTLIIGLENRTIANEELNQLMLNHGLI